MINRELYINQLMSLVDKDVIKVLTGIRRSGKSTILKLYLKELENLKIPKENIILINFELSEYYNITNITELEEYINELTKNTTGRIYLLFDEIQEIEKWEKLINSYYAKKEYDITITGSNADLLSGELSTLLAGRYIEINVYPFSFSEFIEYKKAKDKSLTKDIIENKLLFNSYKKELFYEYIKYGGMPGVFGLNDEDKLLYLKDIYNSIILKDIFQRFNLRNVDTLNKVVNYTLSNIGQLVNGANIHKKLNEDNLKISQMTIYNYLNYIENSFLFYKANREDLIKKNMLKHNEKYYVSDLGFRQALFSNNIDDIGQIIENIVFIELLRRGYNVSVGKVNNKEIDFICRKNNDKIYIQVSYILANDSTVKREFGSLYSIKDNYPKYVISTDQFDFSREGIKHLNLIDFLTNCTEI